MAVYTWSSNVWAGMTGAQSSDNNAHAEIEVRSPILWIGTVVIEFGVYVPNNNGVFAADGEEYHFRVRSVDRLSYEIEKINPAGPSPGNYLERTGEGSVMLLNDQGVLIDRGLAEVSVFRDGAWEASLILEGSDYIKAGTYLYVKGDHVEGDQATLARVDGVAYSGDQEEVALTLSIRGWNASLPPL